MFYIHFPYKQGLDVAIVHHSTAIATRLLSVVKHFNSWCPSWQNRRASGRIQIFDNARSLIPGPGDSEETFSVFESSCHLLLTSLITQR